MIVPEFLRFYGGYTAESLLNEYAIRFFSLVNSMQRLRAIERADSIGEIAIGMAEPKQRESALASLDKSARGLHGILQEVRVIKP